MVEIFDAILPFNNNRISSHLYVFTTERSFTLTNPVDEVITSRLQLLVLEIVT